jgi:DNA polymerase I-like protein with 3'-5' exonuclease and polymerase domains
MARWDGGQFIEIILKGSKKDGTDLHSTNMRTLQKVVPECDRDMAKTFFYAWLYGAGNKKLGAIVGRNSRVGSQLRKVFLKSFPALDRLVTAVQSKAAGQGWLKGLDGRRLKVKSLHSALNLLLQSAGAILMKQALVMFDPMLQSRHGFVPGKDYEFVANVHDEWQIECKPGISHQVGKLGCEAIKEAGKFFSFRCELSGSYDVGDNWAETH